MKVMIGGGGTGGHLFPGVAIAEEIMAQDPHNEVRFVGTTRGIEARVLPQLGWQHDFIEVSGLKTVGLLGAVRGMLRLPKAWWQSRRLLKQHRPDVVIGVGGYASGPLVLTAWLMRIPTAICEQNSIPGLTNKLLGKVVRRVFIAFGQTARFFAARKVVHSGNPVRVNMLQRLTATVAQPAPAPRSDAATTIFVCGGSLGATAVNELASLALIEVAKTHRLAVIHQTGKRDVEAMKARYLEAGVPAEVSEFIVDMAGQYARADLVIGRAGATTVAELAITGKPTIFIPFPTAADNHQEHNAGELVAVGAALMFRQAELTPPTLAAAVIDLLEAPDKRLRMAEAMRGFARPKAGAEIAAWCQATAKR